MAETLVLTSWNGQAYDLTGFVNFNLLRGMIGHGAPAVSFLEDQAPEVPGGFFVSATPQSRRMDIPLYYKKSARQDLIDLRRELVASFHPASGAGSLAYTDTGGSTRQLNEVYMLGGLAGNTDASAAGELWEKAIFQLRALDPYFYSSTLQEEAFSKTTASGTFLGTPFLPITLTDSALFGSKTVNNPGDVVAYPVWTITGALTSLSLINETTGEELSLTYSLGNGEEISIDCRTRRSQTPNGKKVLLGFVDLFEYLTEFEFWGLQPGDNTVRIEAENTDSGTDFELDFYPPYLAM